MVWALCSDNMLIWISRHKYFKTQNLGILFLKMCVNGSGRDIELLARYLPPYGRIITYVCSPLKSRAERKTLCNSKNIPCPFFRLCVASDLNNKNVHRVRLHCHFLGLSLSSKHFNAKWFSSPEQSDWSLQGPVLNKLLLKRELL